MEEALDLSFDRLLMMMMMMSYGLREPPSHQTLVLVTVAGNVVPYFITAFVLFRTLVRLILHLPNMLPRAAEPHAGQF